MCSGGEDKNINLFLLIGRVWVRVQVITLVSLETKTLNHYYCILWMGCKVVLGPVCCVVYGMYKEM